MNKHSYYIRNSFNNIQNEYFAEQVTCSSLFPPFMLTGTVISLECVYWCWIWIFTIIVTFLNSLAKIFSLAKPINIPSLSSFYHLSHDLRKSCLSHMLKLPMLTHSLSHQALWQISSVFSRVTVKGQSNRF